MRVFPMCFAWLEEMEVSEFRKTDRRASAIEFGVIAALITTVIIGGATLAGESIQRSVAQNVPISQIDN